MTQATLKQLKLDTKNIEKYISWSIKRIEELKRNRGASEEELFDAGFEYTSVDHDIESLYRDIRRLNELKKKLGKQ